MNDSAQGSLLAFNEYHHGFVNFIKYYVDDKHTCVILLL